MSKNGFESAKDSNAGKENSKIATHLIPAAIAFLVLISASLACDNSTTFSTSTPWPTATKIPPITIEIAEEDTPHNYKVVQQGKSRSYIIAAKAFCDHYEIAYGDEALHFTPRKEGD